MTTETQPLVNLELKERINENPKQIIHTVSSDCFNFFSFHDACKHKTPDFPMTPPNSPVFEM